MDERRQSPRYESMTIMQYKKGLWSSLTDAVTKDLSSGGVCFYSDEPLLVGTIIRVKLYFDVQKPARELKGKIVWVKESREGEGKGFLNGVSFFGASIS